MAVGHYDIPPLPCIAGITLATSCAGIKQTIKDDVLLIAMNAAASCAAVFTQNAFCAAPVVVARTHLAHAPRWLLINAGNANAGTGNQGMQDALQCCASVAHAVGARTEQVLPFSTGVIGQKLPLAKIEAVVPALVSELGANNWLKAAKAIMTTDTFAKAVTYTIDIDGQPISFNGITKGAGMIQPNMATMLAFIGTDAPIEQNLLQHCLAEVAELSFNRITVDGDTSTNDACVVMASGLAPIKPITFGTQAYTLFSQALLKVAKQLAELIIRDGEGATKLMRIMVCQARSPAEALAVAKTIAHSPLVKTAFFASDPNWGRILAAVGRAGVEAMALECVEIYLNEVCIVRGGSVADDYTESAGQQVMNNSEIRITVNLGRGVASEEVLTCDFSYDYVKINAEYRT